MNATMQKGHPGRFVPSKRLDDPTCDRRVRTQRQCKKVHFARPGSARPGRADSQPRFHSARALNPKRAISPARPTPTQFLFSGMAACRGHFLITNSAPQDPPSSPPASAPAQPSPSSSGTHLIQRLVVQELLHARDCLGPSGEIRLEPHDRLIGSRIVGPTTFERDLSPPCLTVQPGSSTAAALHGRGLLATHPHSKARHAQFSQKCRSDNFLTVSRRRSDAVRCADLVH